jgi:two-component system chemotaxis response regulator CheY
MKILFVEDSALLRRAMVKAVQEVGYKTVEAENGMEALARLRTHGPSIDLVVLDWNMPIMSGYEVLVKMRSQETYSNIPVLMATSDGVEEDVRKAIKAGATGYLVKPFTPEALVKQISGILKSNTRNLT